MTRLLLTVAAVLAFVGCKSNEPQTARMQSALETPATVYLIHSNVTEFDGLVSIPVEVVEVDGNTEVRISHLIEWPITNQFQGFDKFFYNLCDGQHPVIRVQDEGCDQPVTETENGFFEACGWRVNQSGTEADGFGNFASRTSMEPSGEGGSSAPLIFTIQGTVADLVQNANGAYFAMHGRFGGDCSGWFSDGTANSVSSEPACIPIPPPPVCYLSVAPSSAPIVQGSYADFVISATVEGAESLELTLTIEPLPLPTGIGMSLTPNPVTAPGDSLLRITAASETEIGEYGPFTIVATNATYDPPVTCEVDVGINVLPFIPPPDGYNACDCE